MNKKFSTLMAGLMLASAFSVASAQDAAKKYEDGKYYLLGNSAGDKFITVNSDAGSSYGELTFEDLNIDGSNDLKETRNALWKVTVTVGNVGEAPKFAFQNVATGLYLNISRQDVADAGTAGLSAPVIAGSYQEWNNGAATEFTSSYGGSPLMSYTKANEVIYFESSGNTLIAKLATPEAVSASSSSAQTIKPFTAEIIKGLTAKELNTELLVKATEDVFNLSFNKEVTEGAENLFSATALQAVQLYKDDDSWTTDSKDGETDRDAYGYVRLKVKDTDNYIVVDTALHTGSEAERQLPKFTYADPSAKAVDGNNVPRLQESFNFAFAYEPNTNRILIKSEAYYTRVASNEKPVKISGEDGNDAYTYWPGNQENGYSKKIENAYVRLVELSDVRELTVASVPDDASDKSDWDAKWEHYADDLSYGMNTIVTLGQGLLTYQPTSLDEGLYMIKFVQNAARTNATAGDYFIANLGGYFGYAEEAKRQDYEHMPAAQWYVKKNGNTSTSPISITNREFNDGDVWNEDGTGKGYYGVNNYFQAFSASDGKIFFTNGALAVRDADGNILGRDTVELVKVSDAIAADKYLGYKHVTAEQASVETYVFNYLHGLSLENGLNTPSDKDSLVRVDENGAKASFRLVPVIESDSYGIQLDEKKTGIANLVRNVYYIKAYDNSKFEGDRYLSYDYASKKYVMSTTMTPYFLKENNDIDGTHYYALVEAELFVPYAYYRGEKDDKKTDLETVLTSNEIKIYPKYMDGVEVKNIDKGESYNEQYQALENDDYIIAIPFYDKDGQPIVTDNSTVALYAYAVKAGDEKVTLQRVGMKPTTGDDKNVTYYAYMNLADDSKGWNFTEAYQGWTKTVTKDGKEETENIDKLMSGDYADNRVSVEDNTLDLTIASIEDKWMEEIRVSAFEVAINDSPLYRRFNGLAPETYGDASNAPVNLKFFRFNNNAEYLFENQSSDNAYRDGINDKSISFLGVNNAFQYPESETRSYTMYVDTAYVRYETRMPQYLIAIRPEIIPGDTTLCDASTHSHATVEDALACEHTLVKAGFTRAMYLFNAQDSIDAKNFDYNGKAAYGAQNYTRLAFKDAVHAGDTLYILNPNVTTQQLIDSDLKNEDLFADKIFLGDNMHKNVVFSFRLIDSDNNRFLIESESEQDGVAVLNKDLKNVSIAPMNGGWVKIQNGVPVIARNMTFNEAVSQADVFDVNDEIQYDATANDEVAVESVKVIAGDGQVTIMGAAGKNVTITTVLGKTVVAKTIASDNETIAVPTTGIVAVAVEGEEAVMTIVK